MTPIVGLLFVWVVLGSLITPVLATEHTVKGHAYVTRKDGSSDVLRGHPIWVVEDTPQIHEVVNEMVQLSPEAKLEARPEGKLKARLQALPLIVNAKNSELEALRTSKAKEDKKRVKKLKTEIKVLEKERKEIQFRMERGGLGSYELRERIQKANDLAFEKKLHELKIFWKLRDNSKLQTNTNVEGAFEIRLPAGRYYLCSEFPYTTKSELVLRNEYLLHEGSKLHHETQKLLRRLNPLYYPDKDDLTPSPFRDDHGYWVIAVDVTGDMEVDLNSLNLRKLVRLT